MSIDQWIPPTEAAPINLDPPKLARLIALSDTDRLDQLATLLTEHEISWLSLAMHADHEQWQQAASGLGDPALKHLIKVLAAAEMQLPGCEVGPNSPAIAINSVLKARGARLSTDELRWLRAHSRNRFLPNGPLL